MINLNFEYQELFTLQILHEYYKGEKTSDFIILPSIESSNITKRLGLITKQIDNKLYVLIERNKKELLHTTLFSSLTFSFFVYPNNSYFHNFTDLPITISEDEILYFNNKKTEIKNEDPSAINTGEYISEKDYKNIKILTTFPTETSSKKPIALIEIGISDLINNSTKDYFIKFSARKTYWKYAFVSRHRKLENNVSIIVTDGIATNFVRHENEILLNKQEASIFISETPLPLIQLNNQRLSLITKNKMGKTVEIIPLLPLPSVEMAKPEARMKDAKVFSEVVVYL
jgi:hypothetical protein